MKPELGSKTSALRVIASSAVLCTAALSTGALAAPGGGNGWGAARESSLSTSHWKDAQAVLAFEADHTAVAAGETVLLSWAAENVKFCEASGDWDGQQSVSGFYRTSPLDADQTYVLTCRAWSGSVQKSVTVSVLTPATEPAPDASTTPSEPTTSQPGDTTTQPTSPQPVAVSLSASPLEVDYGGHTTLSWSATGADSCSGWGQALATSGSYTTSSLTTRTSFSLSCSGAGGTDSRTVSVSVLPPPEPTLKLSSSSATVQSGGSVTLTWAAENVSGCTATGAWSGSKPASGSEPIGPLAQDSTFTLTCQSPVGDVVAMTSVQISEGGTTLSWEPPHENVDGSPLSDLVGYRVYVGLTSRTYNAPIELNDPSLQSYFVELLPGDYYLSMTAVDAEGNESAFSNEVLKTVH